MLKVEKVASAEVVEESKCGEGNRNMIDKQGHLRGYAHIPS